MKKPLVWLAALCLAACSPKPSLTSPDGRIQLDLTCESGSLSYQVSVDGTPFILPSPLGMLQ